MVEHKTENFSASGSNPLLGKHAGLVLAGRKQRRKHACLGKQQILNLHNCIRRECPLSLVVERGPFEAKVWVQFP